MAFSPHMSRLWLLLMLNSVPALASAFGPGEHTVYEVKYLGLTAGRGDLRVGAPMQRDGHDVWPLVCIGETTSVASLYQLHDRFISYWQPLAQHNVASDFFVDENGNRRRERYRYDRAALKVFAIKQRQGRPAAEREYDVRGDVMDLAAAGFWLRNQPLTLGATFERAIFTGSKQFVMRATVEAKETLTTALGTLETWRVSVNTEFKGAVSTKGNIRVYYTADAKQLPIRAEAAFIIGTVVADVVQYEAGRATTDGVN